MKMDLKNNGFGNNYKMFLRFKKKNLFGSRFVSHRSYKFSKFYKLIGSHSRLHSRFQVISAHFPVTSGTFMYVVSNSSRINYLTDFQLKSCRNIIKKPYKRFLRVYVYPYFGLTRKPAEVRMGKGKGSKVSHHASPVRVGSLIFSSPRRVNSRMSDLRFRDKISTYSSKLSIKSSIQIGSF